MLYAVHAENFRRAFKSLFCNLNNSLILRNENENKNININEKQESSTAAIGIASTSSVYNKGENIGRCAGIGGVMFTGNVITNGFSLANRPVSYLKCSQKYVLQFFSKRFPFYTFNRTYVSCLVLEK